MGCSSGGCYCRSRESRKLFDTAIGSSRSGRDKEEEDSRVYDAPKLALACFFDYATFDGLFFTFSIFHGQPRFASVLNEQRFRLIFEK